MCEQYIQKEFWDITNQEPITDVPVSPDKEIAEATLKGQIDWYESSGVDNYNYFDDACIILRISTIISIDVSAK